MARFLLPPGMTRRTCLLPLLIAVLAAPPCRPEAPEGLRGQVRYRAELEELRTFRHRLVLASGPLLAVLVQEQGGAGGLRIRALGLQTAQIACGALELHGLLRRLSSPLSVGPTSAVLEERTGLSLDTAFLPATRRGLVLGLPAGRAGAFLYREQGRPLKQGAFARVALEEQDSSLAVEAVALTSAPPRREHRRWLADPPPYPGGRLLHCAGGLRARAGPLAVSVSAAGSGSRRLPTGVVADAWAALSLPSLRLRALLGGCTPAYRTPDGEPCPQEVVGAAYARFAAAGLALEGEVERRMGRAALRPGPYRETVTALRAGLEAKGSRRPLDRRCPSFRLRGSWVIGRERQGERRDSVRVEAACELARGGHRWTAGLDWGTELAAAGAGSRELGARLAWSGRRGSLEAAAVLEGPAPARLRARLAAALGSSGRRMSLQLGARGLLPGGGQGESPPRRAGLEAVRITLGWEVRQPLGQRAAPPDPPAGP